MTIEHHPDPATLMAYSAGTLGEALSAVVACHLDLCGECREATRRLDAFGGTLIAELAGAELAGPLPAAMPRQFPRSAEPQPHIIDGLPRTLRTLIGGPIASVKWRAIAPGIQHVRVPLSPGAKGDLLLLKVAPGKGLPDHGHAGAELTLVVSGSYHDKMGRFGPGDLADLDDTVEHEPIVDTGEECICIVAMEQRMRHKGIIPRLLQPFLGI